MRRSVLEMLLLAHRMIGRFRNLYKVRTDLAFNLVLDRAGINPFLRGFSVSISRTFTLEHVSVSDLIILTSQYPILAPS